MGGAARNPSKKRYVETGGEPHYHATDFRYEVAADGTIICYAYEEIRGEARLQFTVGMTGPNLLKAAEIAVRAGADAQNLIQWRDDDTTH